MRVSASDSREGPFSPQKTGPEQQSELEGLEGSLSKGLSAWLLENSVIKEPWEAIAPLTNGKPPGRFELPTC
jgi:hypothetical protein